MKQIDKFIGKGSSLGNEKHEFGYEVKYISIYLKPEDRATIAGWDDKGNLVG